MSSGLRELPPPVLSFDASDATGGSGLQSDVLTVASMGCHPLAVLAAVVVADTRGTEELLALDADAVAAQARALLEDIPVRAFKLGMVGSIENVAAIAEVLSDYPDVPLVVEPALALLDGEDAACEDIIAGLAELVLPQATVLVASRREVIQLAALAPEPRSDDGADEGEDTDDDGGEFAVAWDALGDVLAGDEDEMPLDEALARLLGLGVGHVLLTGVAESGPQVINVLVGPEGVVRTDAWDRLPERYLGAGATLAAALAAALAHGMTVAEAAREAQEFTWQALAAGYRPGMGRAVPDRLFWARSEEAQDD